MRALYRKDGEASRREAARQGLRLAVAVYVLYSVLDVLLIPDVAFYTAAARFGIGAIVLAVIEFQYRTKTRTEWLDLTCAAALISGYIGWIIPAITTVHIQNFAYFMYFGTTFMMGANLFFRFDFKLSLISSGIILFVSLVTVFLFPGSDFYRIAFGTFYLSCFTFTSYVNWKLNKERYKVFLNAMAAKNEHREATERGNALLRLSRTDPLTGLANRRAIDEKMWEYWNDWQQQGSNFAALLIDVDFFKKFNDYYGHQEGDRCLVIVAEALRDAIRDRDGTIGRYGGEEFIVLARLDSRQEVAAFSELIRSTVEKLALSHQHRRDGMSIVTVSVGAALTRKQAGAKLERIIHEADRALTWPRPTVGTASTCSIRTIPRAATRARTSQRFSRSPSSRTSCRWSTSRSRMSGPARSRPSRR